MANYYHGVSTRQVDTSVSTPVEADSGIAFVVGAAPVHTVGGPVNEPVMCYTYQEAVSAFGFSDDWEKYPLCEMIYSQFQLYGVAPVVLVNVLDPAKRVFFPIVAKPKSGNGFRVGVAHDRFVHRPADGMYRRGSDNERNAGIRFNRGRNGRVNLSCRYAVIIVSHGYTSLPLRIAEAMSE